MVLVLYGFILVMGCVRTIVVWKLVIDVSI